MGNIDFMARSLGDLQRFILRRAAENKSARRNLDGDLRYEEIIRKFYSLPRSAFSEVRIAEAAISRSARALVRRRLAVVVHRYVEPRDLRSSRAVVGAYSVMKKSRSKRPPSAGEQPLDWGGGTFERSLGPTNEP
jgi:hypothetical protein